MKSIRFHHSLVVVLLSVVSWRSCQAFHLTVNSQSIIYSGRSVPLQKSVDGRGSVRPSPPLVLYDSIFPDDMDDDEDVEPGKMRVSEIKAELELRSISYTDCFDKESLVQRLRKARKEGLGDPSIFDQFNKQNLEAIFRGESVETIVKNMEDSDIEAAIANDGTIPGGLTPETFKKLMSTPGVYSSLSSTKFQDAMKLIMTGNHRELEKRMGEDSELCEMVLKLDSTFNSMGIDWSNH